MSTVALYKESDILSQERVVAHPPILRIRESTPSREESDPVDDEMDEDEGNNNESSKGPSSADAFSALETAMESGYEQQSAV
ncbi:hypothetical protein TNCV_5077381 [Trichonephila clavipes]|uniref:Uncharacterized protein n=1 Tax=Trichonephila clavipes TaxID=2585209 RepID=A0A8X6RVA6_TRICX|nr:hypothetical protein TNCV_5077381 [Trichonephila clavipes]